MNARTSQVAIRFSLVSLALAACLACGMPPAAAADADDASRRSGSDGASAESVAAPGLDDATVEKWSEKFVGWRHYQPDHVISPKPNLPGYPDVHMTDVPTVYQIPGDEKWYMTFIGFDGKGYQSFVAESADLLQWNPLGLAMGYGPEGDFDHGGVVLGAYLYDSYEIDAPRRLKKWQGQYWSLYGAYRHQGGYEVRPGYEGIATSDDGIHWRRAPQRPGYILSVHEPDVGSWEKDCIYQPWLVEYEGKFYNFYNAANANVEQIGLVVSNDLLNWTRYADNPVIRNRPDCEDAVMASDGKVFRDGDHWAMFYFGLRQSHAHVMLAFSRDLLHWTARRDPIYLAGGHPDGLDAEHAHKISLVYNPKDETWYMFYNAVGKKGRGIGLLTSKP